MFSLMLVKRIPRPSPGISSEIVVCKLTGLSQQGTVEGAHAEGGGISSGG